jgi:hypothetical protein
LRNREFVTRIASDTETTSSGLSNLLRYDSIQITIIYADLYDINLIIWEGIG